MPRPLLGWVMKDLVIRNAGPDDVAAISALVQRTVRISNGKDYPAQAIELIVANFAADKVGQRMAERDVFVCQQGDRVVGTIALGGDQAAFAVRRSRAAAGRRRRATGRPSRGARTQVGVRELSLSSSLTARGFYERLGYRLIELQAHDGVSTFLMAKVLG